MAIYHKVAWRCRRGMLELDIILQRFFEKQYSSLSDEDKNLFARLLEQDDPVLFDWLITETPCHDITLQRIVKRIDAAAIALPMGPL